ncbi:response regulator [Oceanisphaera pacifica]|uniref:Response regulator n=1 Tax=Oceanisphaera pacifica TaxID=2818389 RepID=A0ABS3NHW7_9GAMM|nr:response regulator [Oceanisphaera pacifica]MBO1519826.1 response regulator [Oceanisphaera pacifica]
MPKIPLVYDNADILIVDDNPVNVEVIFQLLEDYGYKAVRSETDSRCVESLLADKMPDLILLDIRMPHIDGYQILELLKKRWPDQAPPVIVLSAQIDPETRLQSLNLGARDFLSKPFDRLEVLQRIHNTLELHFLLRDRSDRAELLEDLVKQRTADLQRLSLADPVTERPNRRGLLALLKEKLHQEQQQQQVSSIKAMAVQPLALHSAEAILYFIVLEGMDEIARMHGYHTSEMLSKAVGDRLQRCATLYSVNHGLQQLGVWGGNEWLLLEFGQATENSIATRANQLIEFMNQPFKVDNLLLHIGVRIGISHSGFVYQSAEDLVRLASMALPTEHNSWQWYQPELEQHIVSLNRCRQAGQPHECLVFNH